MSEKTVVLITGGSRGIGSAIVREFSSSERSVYFTFFNNEDAAEKLVNSLREINPDVYATKSDVSNPDDVNMLVKTIIEKEKHIDILINNAGIIADYPVLMMDNDKWQKVLNTNLNGTFYTSRAVGKQMIKNRKGRIINISSVVASTGGKGQANYISSKAAIEGLTRALAVELAPRGILVNAIAPGIIETDMTTEIREKYSENILNKILLRRIGKPEEIAGVAAFLCSPAGNYITGQVITVDGGMPLNF